MIRARLSYFVVGAAIGFISCAAAFAHVDTGIELKGKTLVGLPSQYSPAELDLEAFRIRIGHHVMEFSPFLSSFFRRQPYDLQVLASWYHEGPPYLVLQITPKGRDYSYDVVLSLDTLRLLGLSVDLRSAKEPPEGFTMQTLPIELTDFQKKQIDESIKDVP
jgi:hypothetical protein